MESDRSEQVTLLLQRMRGSDSDAADRLVPLVIRELRGLARHYLKGERPGHTLQPTALVNEAYLRLVGDQARDWKNRAHFIGVTASIMRRILIDYARRRQALKRGAAAQRLERREGPNALSGEQADELIALSVALDRLEKMNPRQRQVVELRYFGGLSPEETAEAVLQDQRADRSQVNQRTLLPQILKVLNGIPTMPRFLPALPCVAHDCPPRSPKRGRLTKCSMKHAKEVLRPKGAAALIVPDCGIAVERNARGARLRQWGRGLLCRLAHA